LQIHKQAKGYGAFFEQWLALDEVKRIDKDPLIFVDYTTNINTLWASEARLFVEEVIFQKLDMRRLFDGTFSFQNKELSQVYRSLGDSDDFEVEQLSQMPQGDRFEEVALNPQRRSGLLTRGAVLALTTKPYMNDPIHRGIYVRERFLCTPLPPPPPDIVVVAPDPDPTLTTREQFAIHSEDPSCGGCHSLVDPIGFGLGKFDPLGRWQETENGKPIDDQGELISTLDIDGEFTGSFELATKLAQSEQVHRCMVVQFYRYAQGRAENEQDLCGIDQLHKGFKEDHYNFLTLLKAFINTPAFTRLHFEESSEVESTPTPLSPLDPDKKGE
jgi:hypothetical protein